MTGEEFEAVKKDAETAITTRGDFVEDSCIATMCSVLIGQPHEITPRQLAELMDMARGAAHRNLDTWLRMPPKIMR